MRQEIALLVENFQAVPATLLLTGGSTPEPEASRNGHSSSISAAQFVEEAPCVPATEAIDSLVRPLVESVDTTSPAEFAPRPPISDPSQAAPAVSACDSGALGHALEQEADALAAAITPSLPVETAESFRQALEFQAELVLDSIAQQLDIERAGIGDILSSFQKPPATCLLAAPTEILAPPAPPALEWIRTPRPTIAIAAPKDPDLATLTAGPQTPTLAGPCLPPQLQNFTEERSPGRRPAQKRIGFPTWIVSVLVATVVFLAAGSVMQYLMANRDLRADAITGSSQVSAGSTAGAVEETPLARFVEVAGVRITNGVSRKPQLQYIVINHSSRDLSGLAIRVAARSVDEPASAEPLFAVSSKVPVLHGYESREIRTELEAGLRVSSIPDWQSLRTEVQVSGRQ